MKFFTITTTLFLLVFSAQAQVLSVKEQAVTINEVLTDRIDNLLPKLMDEAKIDCWLIISREYNEDPILKTFLPAEWLSARRRTILVFYRDKTKGSISSYAIARYAVGKSIQAAWNPEKEPNQWTALSKLIDSLNPNQIALNTSKDYGHADGLHLTEFNELKNAMTPSQLTKVVSAEKLGVAWLETRTAKEMAFFPTLLSISHQIIKEGFSNRVIQPNKTSTNDLVWWFRQKVSDLGLSTWFHPSVEIQRRISNEKDAIIRPGDLLHVDFGISYLRLNSDVQEHAYVLKPTEQKIPDVLSKAFSTTNSELTDMPSAAQIGVIQPMAAKGSTRPLYRLAQVRFSMMMRRVRCAMCSACTRLLRRLDSSTASALVFARSVAEPMATLMSAAASTGTSLTPSPSISTLRPC